MPLTPQSPEWWATRLYRQLAKRQPAVTRFERYYDGEHDLPWLAPQAEDAFRRILKMTRTNYCGLVVDATYERMEVLGFRRDGQNDPAAWAIWQASNMRRWAPQGIAQAVKTGASYLLVSPREGRRPRITVEHPGQAIVEYEPGDYETRAAALRVWEDDTDDVPLTRAMLYLPNRTHEFKGSRGSAPAGWDMVDDEGQENPYGVVPVVEMANHPNTFGVGRSELSDVTDIQDRINKTIADRLMTQDYGAFPQRWASNWPEELDEESDTVVERAWDAEPTRTARSDQAPVDIGRDRLLVGWGDVKFGQFDSAPLDPYSLAKREDVKDIAARTRVPPQFLLGDMANLSAEALKAAESGLVAKVLDRRQSFADAFEEAMRLAFLMDGDAREDDTLLETVWRNPEFRTEGQLVDALVKLVTSLGMPVEAAWEQYGKGPTEIERWKEMQRDQSTRTLGSDLAGLLGGDLPTVMDPEELLKRANAAGTLIRSGFEPDDALRTVGLDPIEHTGLLPVTVQTP